MATQKLKSKMPINKRKVKVAKINYGIVSLLCLTSAITSTGVTVYSAFSGNQVEDAVIVNDTYSQDTTSYIGDALATSQTQSETTSVQDIQSPTDQTQNTETSTSVQDTQTTSNIDISALAEGNTTDKYLTVETPGMTFDEAAHQLGITNVNSQYKLESKDSIVPSASMTEQALSQSKRDVQNVYDALMDTDYSNIYDISYNEQQNIIYIENKDKSILKTGVNFSTLFKLSDNSTVLTLNSGSNAFTTEKVETDTDAKSKGTYVVASEGFNGFIELMVGNTPVIFYNSPDVDPLLDEDILLQIEELMQPTVEKIENPNYAGNANDNTTNGDLHNGDAPVVNDDYYVPHEEYIPEQFVPEEEPEILDDYTDTDSFWTEDTSGNSYDDTSSQYEDDFEIPGIPRPSDKYRPVWGTTETGDHLKDNIKDGKEILERVYSRPVLNVVDKQGNLVDLEKKTKETKPAELKRREPVPVGEFKQQPDRRPLILGGYILSAISFLGFFISTRMYYKEGMRNATLMSLEEDSTTIEATNFDTVLENGQAEGDLVDSALR